MVTLYSNKINVAAYRPFNNAYTFYLEILRGEQSVLNNNTPIYVNIYAHGNQGFNYNSYGSIPKITSSLYDSKNKSTREIINNSVSAIPVNSKTLIGSWSGNLEHDDNGNLTISISISYRANSTNDYMPQNMDLSSGNIALSTIARKSEVACSNFNVGENTVITIGRKNDNFTHTVTYQFGTLSGTIASKTTSTSLVWKYNYDSFYNVMSNTRELQGKIICQTFSGNTKIGESECKFTATVKDLPTISNINIEDTNDKTNVLTSSLSDIVKYESIMKVTITAIAPKGTIIKNYRIVGNGIDLTQTSNVFTLSNIESSKFSIYVTDNRKNTNSTTKNINLISYVKLDFLNIETKFVRLKPTGSDVKLIAKGYYFDDTFGKTSNSITLKYRYKERGTSKWSNYVIIDNTEITLSNSMFNLYKNIEGSFNYLKTYEFELIISDKIRTISLSDNANMVVLTGERIMSKYKDRVDFKKITIGNSNEVLGFRVIREIPD